MKLFVRNMVSLRCKMIVKSELENLGLHFITVELGEVEIRENLSADNEQLLRMGLLKYALELMEDKRAILLKRL